MPDEIFERIKKRLEARGNPRLWPPFNRDEEVGRELMQMNPQDLTRDEIRRPEFAGATVAGLLLWADCLEESHRLSQEIPNTTGSFWHGIMHRREADYPNARYWFGRVGNHPVFPEIYSGALEALGAVGTPEAKALREEMETWAAWNPMAFIALVERAKEKGTPGQEQALEAVQAVEIRLLVDWTYRQAIS
ncbi:MAG: hypothetical protein ACUVSM_13945 [Armatimonadota bacterium]